MLLLFYSFLLLLPISATTRDMKVSITINAPVDLVWKKVITFNDYPNWNPSIQSISGECKKDANVTIKCTSPSGRKWDLPSVITEVSNNAKLAWQGTTWGITGEQSFLLEKVSEKQCTFTITEYLSGWYLYFAWPLMQKGLRTSFENHCKALKELCEKKS